MPRPRNTIPKLCHDRSRNRAFCKVNGRFVVLGPWGSPEAQAAYGRLLATIANGGDPVSERSTGPAKPTTVTINDVCLAFLLHAQSHYMNPKTGKPSAELDCFRSAIRPAVALFGETPISEFGPLRLSQVRDEYLTKDWSRGFINKSTNRLRHVVRWAVGRELCPPAVLQALEAVEPLRAGKTSARETKPRQAVSGEHLTIVREKLDPLYRDMVDLLLLCGCRPGELQSLTGAMIDRSGPVWVATITDHKNAWRGLDRKLYFGPKAQLILRRWLNANPDQRLFPLARATLSNAIKRACADAEIPRFTAYHLRHTRATEIRDQLGLEAAQAALGHQNPSMTLHYSSKLDNLAATVAAKLG